MSLNPTQSEQLKKQIQALLEGARAALAETISQTVTVGVPEVVLAQGWAEIPDHFENESPLMATVLMNEPFESLMCLLIKGQQAQVVADFMMGGAGAPEDEAVTDLQLSAVGEALNQMFNTGIMSLNICLTASTSVNSPQITVFSESEWLEHFASWRKEALVSVHGSWTIADGSRRELLEFVLVLEEQLAQQLVAAYKEQTNMLLVPEEAGMVIEVEPDVLGDLTSQLLGRTSPGVASAIQPEPVSVASAVGGGGSGGGAAFDGGGRPGVAAGAAAKQVMVQPVSFGTFDQQSNIVGEENRNLNLLLDIRLNLTVELGRTKLTIKDVLELTRGSIVELDRIAGEPVDLYANGKLIARGEVVVIEDNFGLRLTSIVSPADRLRTV